MSKKNLAGIDISDTFLSKKDTKDTEDTKEKILEQELKRMREEVEQLRATKPELKSVRTQLLMAPSVKTAIKKVANEEGYSMNDYIHQLLIDHLKEKGAL